ncbi:hypothetical protein Tco_1382891, partial [Tanacetum coccineum]
PEGYDLMLWGDLHTLFEPDEEDEIWKSQHEYNVISWSLYDFCGIYILLMQNGIAIHMLTEKKYPLNQEMISKMLKKKLEVDHESPQAFELLRKLKFVCHWADPIKDLEWPNVPRIKISSLFESDDTFSSLQVLSDLYYLFSGFMDYLWSRDLDISNFGPTDR